MSVWILRKTFSSLEWCELLKEAASAAGWPEGKEVFTYHEGLHECRFDRRVWSTLEPPENGWEGRLFEEPAQVRWVRVADGLYRGWLVREMAAPGKESDIDGPFLARKRDYFLLGRYSESSRGFVEARYPGVTFVYPLDGAPTPGTRAKVEVTEYRREKGNWNSCALESDINERLAAPILVEHRFSKVAQE